MFFKLAYLKLAVFLFILVNFLFINVSSIDPDLGWHIRVGERIAETRAVPRLDEFSHTMAGQRWVDHEWLQDAALWWLKSQGFWWLVVAGFTLLAALPFAFWLWRARSPVEMLIALLAAFLMSKMVGVRPQIVSFLFFFLAFELVTARPLSRPGRFGRGAALIVLFWAWANLHAGFAAGLFLWFLYLAVFWGEQWWRYRDTRGVWTEIVLFAAAAGATFLNPYGWGLHHEVWRTLTSFETSRYIVEWQPALSVYDPASLLWLFLGAFLFLFGRYWRQFSWASWLTALVFFAAFLKSVRMAPLFFVASLPVITQGIRALEVEVSASRQAQPFSRRERGVLWSALAGLFILVLGFFGWATFKRQPESFPEKAVEVLREHTRVAGGRLFNEYGWGGYLIERAPEMKVFIDGRMPHWQDDKGRSAMQDYATVFYGGDEEAVKNVLKRRGITTILIRNEKRAPQRELREARNPVEKILIRMGRALTKNPKRDLKTSLVEQGWRVLFEDALAVVLVQE